jgi:hypothetical protein
MARFWQYLEYTGVLKTEVLTLNVPLCLCTFSSYWTDLSFDTSAGSTSCLVCAAGSFFDKKGVFYIAVLSSAMLLVIC